MYNNPQDDKKNHVKPKTDYTCTRAIKNNIYKVTLYFLHDIIILNFCMDTYNIKDARFFAKTKTKGYAQSYFLSEIKNDDNRIFLPNRLGIGPIFDPLMTSKNNKKRWADAIMNAFCEGQIFRALETTVCKQRPVYIRKKNSSAS